MKKATVELIVEKLKDEIWKIENELRINKRKINELAMRQGTLKDARHKLYQLLYQVKGG